jgi:hypothetical protein
VATAWIWLPIPLAVCSSASRSSANMRWLAFIMATNSLGSTSPSRARASALLATVIIRRSIAWRAVCGGSSGFFFLGIAFSYCCVTWPKVLS